LLNRRQTTDNGVPSKRGLMKAQGEPGQQRLTKESRPQGCKRKGPYEHEQLGSTRILGTPKRASVYGNALDWQTRIKWENSNTRGGRSKRPEEKRKDPYKSNQMENRRGYNFNKTKKAPQGLNPSKLTDRKTVKGKTRPFSTYAQRPVEEVSNEWSRLKGSSESADKGRGN